MWQLGSNEMKLFCLSYSLSMMWWEVCHAYECLTIIVMSEFIQYEFPENIPKNRERPLNYSSVFNHQGKCISSDNHYIQYLSDRIRVTMRSHDISHKYELDHFIRYEYSAAPGSRWRSIFEAHSCFSNRSLELIKVYIYGYFNEKNEFVEDKLKVVQGEEVVNMNSVITKFRLLPK